MDESGTHQQSPVLTVGAYMARQRDWQAWSRRWKTAKRPIKVFHSVDCANLKGEFKTWNKEKRDEYVRKLLPVIADSRCVGFVIGIVLTEFNLVMRKHPELSEIFGSPYHACFQWIVMSIMQRLNELGSLERLAFYHESNDFKGEAKETFDYLRKTENPFNVRMSLTFGGKDEFMPLQAADILAYEGNKRLRDVGKPVRRALQALDPNDDKLTISFYGKETMPEMIRLLTEFRRIMLSGTMTPSEAYAYMKAKES